MGFYCVLRAGRGMTGSTASVASSCPALASETKEAVQTTADVTYSTYSLVGVCLSPSGFPSGPAFGVIGPPFPCSVSSCRFSRRRLLMSSSVCMRSFSRGWETGDMGDGGTAFTGVWICGGMACWGWFGGGCIEGWPLEGTAIGDCWAD